MSSLAHYFSQHRPEPRYAVGDRVQGHYLGCPFVGTVYTDNLRSLLEGPRVSIHLDLPLRVGQEWKYFIRVAYADIKALRS
jgi:hypothetical protein